MIPPLKPLAALLAVVVCAAMAQEPCVTPDNLSGQCIVVDDCPFLKALQKKPDRTTEETKLLLSSQCGQIGRNPKVCCSAQTVTSISNCITPNHLPGTCTNLYDCPAFQQMLTASAKLPNQTREYLILSKCTGPAKFNVCCKYPKVPTQREEESDIILNPDDPITEKPKKVQNRFTEEQLPSECGALGSSDRIIGGEEAGIDDYPWMVLIEYKTRKNTTNLGCAGSLISAKYVLTAAHCVYGNIYATSGIPANIRLGEHNKSTSQDCVPVAGGGYDCNDNPVIIPIETIIIHEQYNHSYNNYIHDLALIRMIREAPKTFFISPVCLPTSDAFLDMADNDRNLTVAGWGKTEKNIPSEVKLFIRVPYKTLATCQQRYTNVTQLEDTQMCAGGNIGQDSCKGDSGGPLMDIVDLKLYLVGVVSIGMNPCAAAGKPGIYTKVIRYKEWILSNMKP